MAGQEVLAQVISSTCMTSAGQRVTRRHGSHGPERSRLLLIDCPRNTGDGCQSFGTRLRDPSGHLICGMVREGKVVYSGLQSRTIECRRFERQSESTCAMYELSVWALDRRLRK
jgi:hypothetical protein